MMKVTWKIAASSLVIGATMVGCASPSFLTRPTELAASSDKAESQAARFDSRMRQKALKGDFDEALRFAEQAVEHSPRDVAYRANLADLYVKNGRFRSAEATYADVLALNPGNAHAALNLALAQIAQGRNYQAVATLEEIAATADPSDVGLAFALAGQFDRAFELLIAAARAPQATARVRQNLALTFAFAGDWQRARLVAAQDVPVNQLDERMQQWASLANPAKAGERVASLLGVSPAADPGQPVRLALAPEAPVQFAAAEPVAEAAPEVATPAVREPVFLAAAPAPARAPVDLAPPAPALPFASGAPARLALAEPAPMPVPVALSVPESWTAAAPAAPVMATASPLPQHWTEAPDIEEVHQTLPAEIELAAVEPSLAQAGPVSEPAFEAVFEPPAQPAVQLAAAVQSLVQADAALLPAKAPRAERVVSELAKKAPVLLKRARERREAVSHHVVQIGAYRTADQVETAWARHYKRFAIGDHVPLSTTVQLPGKGLFHRLSVSGFRSRGEAVELCNDIRARGGSCFVRATAGDAPTRWASRYRNNDA